MTRKRCRCFVNCRNFVAKLAGIEVHLDPDVQARLARIAAERGRDPEALAKEVLEQFVNVIHVVRILHGAQPWP